MDPIEKQQRKREAWRRVRAQRQRAGRLRGRVVAISLICFALLWTVVFAQMATGNDPVLSAKEKALTSTTNDRAKAKAKAGRRSERQGTELESERAATDATGSGDPRQVESQLAEIERAELEAAEAEVAEVEGEFESEPEFVEPQAEPEEFVEVEPEPLTTSQS